MKRAQSKKRAAAAALRKGRLAENLACLMLRARGFSILARRYQPRHRGGGGGEIDIIARRRALVVFVEVKSRASDSGAGDVSETLSPQQCRRIAHTARAFLAQAPDAQNLTARFDAVFFTRRLWPRYVADAWQEDVREGIRI